MNKDRVKAFDVMLKDLNSMLLDRTFEGQYIQFEYNPHTNLLRVEMFKNGYRVFHRVRQPREEFYAFLLETAQKEYQINEQDI